MIHGHAADAQYSSIPTRLVVNHVLGLGPLCEPARLASNLGGAECAGAHALLASDWRHGVGIATCAIMRSIARWRMAVHAAQGVPLMVYIMGTLAVR